MYIAMGVPFLAPFLVDLGEKRRKVGKLKFFICISGLKLKQLNLIVKKLVLLVDVSDDDDEYEDIHLKSHDDTDELKSVIALSENRYL